MKNTQGARKHTLNTEYFKNIKTEEQAYWLGFLMADGCVYKGSDKHSYRLQINLKASDTDQLEKFNTAIESDYLVSNKKVHNNKTGKDYDVAQLKINCTSMCLDLIELNVKPRKSLVCKMPDIDKSLYRHYLRGYFDGDGCITTSNNKWHISIVGGEPMLKVFQEYLAENDIYTSLYVINHSKAKSLEISSHKMIKRFYDLTYTDASVFLDRKYDKFVAFMNCPAA